MEENLFEWVQDMLSIAGNIAELIGLALLIRGLQPSSARPSAREKRRSY